MLPHDDRQHTFLVHSRHYRMDLLGGKEKKENNEFKLKPYFKIKQVIILLEV